MKACEEFQKKMKDLEASCNDSQHLKEVGKNVSLCILHAQNNDEKITGFFCLFYLPGKCKAHESVWGFSEKNRRSWSLLHWFSPGKCKAHESLWGFSEKNRRSWSILQWFSAP